MLRVRSALALVVSVMVAAACGGGGGGGEPKTAEGPEGAPDGPLDNATVYDEVGKSHACEVPKPSCLDAKEPSRDFKDKCALEGFRIIQCGCDQYCTGNAMAEQLHYGANNVGKLCAKAKDECEPPETSAAFQDACTSAKGKFVVCGCEWLCTRKLKNPVSNKPPPEDEPEAEPETAPDAEPKPAPK
jgi:hypothetical protein